MSFFYLKKVYIKKFCIKTAYLGKACFKKVCKSPASGIAERFLPILPVYLAVLFLLCGCGVGSPQPVLEAVPGTYGQEDLDSGKTELSGSNREKPESSEPDREKTDSSGLNPEKTSSSESDPGRTDSAGQDPKKTASAGRDPDSESNEAKALPGDDIPGTLTVHVCGAVKKEGVYSLPEGSRIRDAIEAAGGFDKEADTSFLNLALKLEDSWQIRVPTVTEAEKLRQERGSGKAEEAVLSRTDSDTPGITRGTVSGEDAVRTDAESGSSSAKEPKININTASVEELMNIPGIGESKAKKIIEYREKNGRFETVEDIMKVKGIKENSFRKMQDYITV